MRLNRRMLLRATAASGITASGLGIGTRPAAAIELDCALSNEFFHGDGTFTTQDVTVESFDGTELAATVYEPDPEGPHPAVLMTHGWGLSRDLLRCTAGMYADNGYVALTYDSRGYGDSDGEVGVNGPNEVGDTSTLIDWLADHDAVIANGDDPSVGMDGGSYGGGIQLLAATRDNRIDAIVPRIAWNDFVTAITPNGAIKSGWLTFLVGSGSASSRFTGDIGESIDPKLQDWYIEAMAENEISEGAVEYFRERSPTRFLETLETPTLVISGWKDTLFPPSEAVANYREIDELGVESRLVMYGSGHNIDELGVTDEQHEYMNRAALDWMDRHVRGAETDVVPPVSLWDDQASRWRTYDDFPGAVERTVVSLDGLAGTTSPVSQRLFWDDEAASYEIESDGFRLRGTPALSVSIEAHDAPLICFASLHHTGDSVSTEQIDDQVTGFRLEETGTHRFDLDLEPLLREIPRGDALELRIEATDPFYLDEYGAATVHNDESTLTLPIAEGSL
ncbi:alpha/beta hydrolase family protein [Natrinema altunense]|nr:CocE/NonD family hydrolase [Natrinema altunense]